MTQDTKSKLSEILTNIGLSGSETKVFSYLLRQAEGLKAVSIAKRVQLNRTTTYSILKSLIAKGLVSSSEEYGVLRYQALDPRLLPGYIEREKERLSATAKRYQKLIPELVSNREPEERYRPSIQFYDGTDGIKQVYENILTESAEKKVYGFIGTEALFKLIDEDFIDYYLRKRTAKGVRWFTHATESAESRRLVRRDTVELRDTKLLPSPYKFDIELASYDDTTIIISYAEDHPLGIVIRDKKIAETIKTLFRYIDSTLPPK